MYWCTFGRLVKFSLLICIAFVATSSHLDECQANMCNSMTHSSLARRRIMKQGVRTIKRGHSSMLNGEHMKVGIYRVPPLDNAMSNVSVVMLDELSKQYNLTYTLYTVHTVQEELESLINGTIDLDITLFANTYQRNVVVDFLTPLMQSYFVVVIKKPKRARSNLLNLLVPFDTYIWITLLVYLLGTATIMVGLHKISSCTVHNTNKETRRSRGLGYYIQYMYASFLQQGGAFLPNSLANRTLLSIWWLFVLVICGLYTGILVSTLAIDAPMEYPFETIEQLSVHQSLIPTVIQGQAAMDLLHSSPPESSLGQLWKKVKSDSNGVVDSYKSALDLVLTGKYVFITNNIFSTALITSDITSSKVCRLTTTPVQIRGNYSSWILPKHSKYKVEFQQGLQQLLASGIRDKFYEEFFSSQHSSCPLESTMEVNAESITLKTMFSTFIILPTGFALACFALLFEFAAKKCYFRKSVNDSEFNIQYISAKTNNTFLDC